MFVACGIWCLADVSSVSPSSEQTALLRRSNVICMLDRYALHIYYVSICMLDRYALLRRSNVICMLDRYGNNRAQETESYNFITQLLRGNRIREEMNET